MAVPVVGEAGFDLKVLAGETQVEGAGAGDGLGFAPGLVGSSPDGGLGGIRHSDGAAEMVCVDHEQDRGGGDVIHDGQGQVSWRVIIGCHPDIFPGGGSG
jgi:hypothetical protein